jgi:cell division protein FtsI/penicillin-binding protein 2
VEEALYRSYNIGMARLADGLGLERMIGLFERLGFRRNTKGQFRLRISPAWERIGRKAGSISHPSRWRSGISNISWSFGQEMRLTLLDLASAYTAIATDGRLRPPILVRNVVHPGRGDRGGEGLSWPASSRSRLFSAATAARLRKALNQVVEGEGGTLNRLYRSSPELFGGYAMAGKTGTATEETESTKRSLVQKAWCEHSENILNLVVMGPIGSGHARYIVALTAPHPRAKDKRYVSAGRVLGRHGVQIMRFLLDRDRLAGSNPTGSSAASNPGAAGSGGSASRIAYGRVKTL